MKKIVLLGLLAAAVSLTAEKSFAYADAPWCLQANVGRSVTERCEFGTFEACARERTYWGTTAFCTQNPAPPGYWSGLREPRRPLHRHKDRRRHQG